MQFLNLDFKKHKTGREGRLQMLFVIEFFFVHAEIIIFPMCSHIRTSLLTEHMFPSCMDILTPEHMFVNSNFEHTFGFLLRLRKYDVILYLYKKNLFLLTMRL